MIRTSAAPIAKAGIGLSVRSSSERAGANRAACLVRFIRDSSSEDCICMRTVRNTASATNATARPTAMVVSTITRLASDRR